jgi:hypothetical protein
MEGAQGLHSKTECSHDIVGLYFYVTSVTYLTSNIEYKLREGHHLVKNVQKVPPIC